MFDDLADLYQEVILDHSRRPRHGHKLECFDATARGDNPMCGDRVQLFVRHAPDGSIEDVGFEARGCAISVASADMMAEVLRGRTDEEARRLPQASASWRGPVQRRRRRSGRRGARDVAAARRRAQYPSRVKCATLAWHALIAALADGKEASSE